MQGFVRGFLLFGFLFSFSSSSYGFVHESVRIRSLGSDFTGLIEDPYTDVFRNPAYLARWGKGALTAEVLDAEKSIFGANLAVPLKFASFGISYKVHGHPQGFLPEDGRDFSGQRVASDLDAPRFPGEKKFQIVRGLAAKSISKINFGADVQYLRDWVFSGDYLYYTPPFYNQLPTALQARGGIQYAPNKKWSFDATVRYQRDRPRLTAAHQLSRSAYEQDSGRNIYFEHLYALRSSAFGHIDEWGAFLSARLSLTNGFGAAIIFSAERLKGNLPIHLESAGGNVASYPPSPYTYERAYAFTIDTLAQHFQWKYRTGFALSKTLPSGSGVFGGATIAVTRTREFYTSQLDSSVQFRRNEQILEDRETSITSGGEKAGLLYTELSIPTAVELKPKGNFTARIGLKPLLTISNWDVGGHSADLNTFYSLGFGMTFEEHIQVETFAEEDLGDLQNWQIALRYVF